MSDVKITINDQEMMVKAGQTILKAAEEVGIYIPTLCFHPALQPSGSCRLCAVEIEGYRGLPAACTTEVAAGMKIRTNTPKVIDFRREMLRIILQDHPRECLGCPRNGTCELQQLVTSVGIDFPYPPPALERPPAELAGAYFERDYSLCVRCGRCVRVCHEVRGARAIIFRDRQGRQEVSTPLQLPLEQAGCQFCGACVDICPTGALRENMQDFQREPKQHIQQVCASLTNIVWDLYRQELQTQFRTAICPVCSAGCRLQFEINGNELVSVKPDPAGPANRGQACVQGRFLLKSYRVRPNRLTTPLQASNGGYEPTHWDSALNEMAKRLTSYAPAEVAILTDARATNEELFALNKYARQVLKTGAVGCLAVQGHHQASAVLKEQLGRASATSSVQDLKRAKTIFAIGFNAAATHPIAGTCIRDAVLNGSKLIVANPYEVAIARYADVHLNYIPGTEIALLLGLFRAMNDEGWIDSGWQEKNPDQWAQLQSLLEDYNLETVTRVTGISREDLFDAAEVLAEEGALAVVYGHGILESNHIKEIFTFINVMLQMKNSFGQAGGGIIPLYGTSNLQGAMDMGAEGDLMEKLQAGKIRALWLTLESYQENMLECLRPYLDNVEFLVIQDVVVPPPEIKADLLLPMASLLEKEGTLTTNDRRVQWTERVFTPPKGTRSLTTVVAELMKRAGNSEIKKDDPQSILADITQEIPEYAGITHQRLRFSSLQWPCPDPDHPGSPVLFAEQNPLPVPLVNSPSIPAEPESLPDDEFPFAVVAKESIVPFFLGPLLAPEAEKLIQLNGDIEMNPANAYSLGYQPGDEVTVTLRNGECSGRLAMNKLLPLKLIVISSEKLAASCGISEYKGKTFAARVADRSS